MWLIFLPVLAIYWLGFGHIWPGGASSLNFFIDVCDGTGGAWVGRRNVAHIDEKIRMEHPVSLRTYQ